MRQRGLQADLWSENCLRLSKGVSWKSQVALSDSWLAVVPGTKQGLLLLEGGVLVLGGLWWDFPTGLRLTPALVLLVHVVPTEEGLGCSKTSGTDECSSSYDFWDLNLGPLGKAVSTLINS